MRDTPNGTWPAQIVPHCISTLSTPCHCERIDMSHRLIHALPETTHGAGRVEILHISKEKMSPTTNAQVRGYLGKMLRIRRTQYSDCVHICAKWRRRLLSTTETRRDLVKLFSAGESLSPVPGFDRGSCVPPDPRSNYAAGLILRVGPAAPCYPGDTLWIRAMGHRDCGMVHAAGKATFRLVGTLKSVLELHGTDHSDRQITLLEG